MSEQNRFLDRFRKNDLSTAFSQPPQPSSLMRHAHREELQPIVVRAAQQALAIELLAHKGMTASQLYDQLFLQGFQNTTQVIQMSAIHAGLSADDPEVQKMLREVFEAGAIDYVSLKKEVLKGVTPRLIALATEDPRPEVKEEPKTLYQQVKAGFEKLW